MKVIGVVDVNSFQGKFIVEVGGDEIRQILGDPYSRHGFQVGDVVEVNKAWSALANAKATSEGVVAAVAALRSQASAMESLLQPFIKQQTTSEPPPAAPVS